MAVALYTVRLLLKTLGVESYGIYSVVGGVVALLGFLNSAMTVATQRYLSYYQGVDKEDIQNQILSNSLILHLIISFIVCFFLFSLENILFSETFNIPLDKIKDAKSLYLFMIGSVFFNIILVPYRAVLNAKENILTDSIILVIQSLLKLIAIIYLSKVDELNQLGYLGLVYLIVNIVIFLIYFIYCTIYYESSRFKLKSINNSLLVELSKFAGWNLYTNICYVLNTQGLNVLLNTFFLTSVNAAFSIGNQVNTQIKQLSQSMLRAISPQIMKSEGDSNRDRTVRIANVASKFGFFLVAIISIPSIFMMEKILTLWLGDVPKYATLFASYFLLSTLINQLTVGVNPAIQAVGNIRRFQLVIGTLALLVLPLSYITLSFGLPVTSVLYILIITEVFTGIIKIIFYIKVSKVTFWQYVKDIVFRISFPAIGLGGILMQFKSSFPGSYSLYITYLTAFILYPPLFYLFTLTNTEKNIVLDVLNKITKKLNK
ncbi:MATE family efflux transporter [Vibrio natriegens]|uniref:MATE family efflux transporter n=1 Tax=Vibrio natriegens TaxID=691 RepID=UPI003F876951